jgi:hypothetical protein
MKNAIIAALVSAAVAASSAGATLIVTSRNIKNGTIQLADISPRARAALRGQRGPRGAQGAQGAQGVPGVIASVTETVTTTTTVAPGTDGRATVDCPVGLRPISGGYSWLSLFGNQAGVSILSSRRSQSQQGWTVDAHNGSGATLVNETPARAGVSLQGRQDSNLQPPVLETGALPVELRPSRFGRLIVLADFGRSRRR